MNDEEIKPITLDSSEPCEDPGLTRSIHPISIFAKELGLGMETYLIPPTTSKWGASLFILGYDEEIDFCYVIGESEEEVKNKLWEKIVDSVVKAQNG